MVDQGWTLTAAAEAAGVSVRCARKWAGRYLPGERGWIKTKNRDYWRRELERERALRQGRVRQFV